MKTKVLLTAHVIHFILSGLLVGTLGLLLHLAGAVSAQAQGVSIYANTNQTSPQALFNGGAENHQGANIITRLVADDITPAPGFAGRLMQEISFSVYNSNATPYRHGFDSVSGNPTLAMAIPAL